MHGGDVGPVESQHQVDESLHLVVVRGDHSQEVAVDVLVAEVHAGGRVADLGDVEDLQQVLHLDGGLAGSGADQADDGLADAGAAS